MITLTTNHLMNEPDNLSSDEYGIYYKGPNLTIVKNLSKPLYIWFFAGNIFEDNHLQHPTTNCGDARYNLKKYMETIDPEIHIKSHNGLTTDLKGIFTNSKSIKGSLKDGFDKSVEYIYTFNNTTNKICVQINLTEDGTYSIRIYSEEKLDECMDIEMTLRYTEIEALKLKEKED